MYIKRASKGSYTSLNTKLFLFNFQIEEALVHRKKMELLQQYASESLQAEASEAKTLLGL